MRDWGLGLAQGLGGRLQVHTKDPFPLFHRKIFLQEKNFFTKKFFFKGQR